MANRIALLLACCSVVLCCCGHSEASGIVALRSANVRPYNEALQGFKSVKHDFSVTDILLSEADDNEVIRRIRRIRPDLILAIGPDAVEHVKEMKDLPIVYVMLPRQLPRNGAHNNIAGVSMYISPARYLNALTDVFPQARRIGLVYNPNNSDAFVKEAFKTAKLKGVELVVKEAERSENVPVLIDCLRNKIDVFWMLPDITVVTPETVDHMLLLSFENRVPVFTFSLKYVEMGAVAGLKVVPSDLGVQAGELAVKLLSDKPGGVPVREDARKTILVINRKMAGKLSLRIPGRLMDKAEYVD